MEEDFFLYLASYRSDFTAVENIIADYFLARKRILTIGELSKELAVSKSSITRFTQAIGLDNYKELIFLYRNALKENKSITSSSKIISGYRSLANKIEESYSQEKIERTCKLIKQAKIIHFFGKGFNSYAGLDFQFKFSRFGKYVRVISDSNSILLSANSAEKGELIIVSSLRGEDPEIKKALKIAKQKEINIILITGNKESELNMYSTLNLQAPELARDERFGNISPQIPILMQLDIVYENYIHLYSESVQYWTDSEKILHNK